MRFLNRRLFSSLCELKLNARQRPHNLLRSARGRDAFTRSRVHRFIAMPTADTSRSSRARKPSARQAAADSATSPPAATGRTASASSSPQPHGGRGFETQDDEARTDEQIQGASAPVAQGEPTTQQSAATPPPLTVQPPRKPPPTSKQARGACGAAESLPGHLGAA